MRNLKNYKDGNLQKLNILEGFMQNGLQNRNQHNFLRIKSCVKIDVRYLFWKVGCAFRSASLHCAPFRARLFWKMRSGFFLSMRSRFQFTFIYCRQRTLDAGNPAHALDDTSSERSIRGEKTNQLGEPSGTSLVSYFNTGAQRECLYFKTIQYKPS